MLNPRQVRVAALTTPTAAESTQWYFQRYIEHLPSAGELVLFDRSWYNRAGVEKVMGFCSDDEYKLFLEQAPVFEKMLTDDGILLFKYWLAVDQKHQEERFAERAADPLKRWKLSPVDLEAREALRRVRTRARHHAQGDEPSPRPVDGGRLQRSASRPAQPDPPSAERSGGLQRPVTAREPSTASWQAA